MDGDWLSMYSVLVTALYARVDISTEDQDDILPEVLPDNVFLAWNRSLSDDTAIAQPHHPLK